MDSAHAPVIQVPATQASEVPSEMAVDLSISDVDPQEEGPMEGSAAFRGDESVAAA